jgi:hypothetical protein
VMGDQESGVRSQESGRTWRALPIGLLVVLILTLLGVIAVYHFGRSVIVNVGDLGDSASVSGFYADEPDLSYRYRWSKAESAVRFDAASSAPVSEIEVVAQGARPGDFASMPVTISLSVNGQLLEPPVMTLTQELSSYTFRLPLRQSVEGPLSVVLRAGTFAPPGDGRELGVKVDQVRLGQSANGLNLPPLWVILWSLVLVAGAYGLLSGFRGVASIVAASLVALLLAIGLVVATPVVGAYMPPVAAVMGLGGLIVWQGRRVSRWPEWVDALGKAHIATRVMLGALLLYAALALWTIAQVDWIGHADYAENAVIARNFVEGRGLTVDYVAQFYNSYPAISHPADTWPLLQPLMISPFFAVFGPQTWAAKLPNLLVMLALAWAVSHVGSRVWEPRVGLLAGIFTLAHPYFFNSVLYPINDLPFTALFFVLAWLVWRQLSPASQIEAAGDSVRPLTLLEAPKFITWRLALTGALAGLLVWSKPSGVVLLAGLALWVAWTWWRAYRPAGARVPWRPVGVLLGAFALVLLPLVLRNLLAFGTPYFTTESYDAPILRYWPQIEWENIYKLYAGVELPHPRWVMGGKFGYQNLFDAFGTNLGWVWQQGVFAEPGEGNYVLGLLPLAGALLGLAALTRRTANLFGMVGLSLGLYIAFVLVYWHFEGRYFQVAVPWLLLLLAWGLFWAWDRLRETLRGGLGRRWGLLLLPVAVVALLWPHVSVILRQVETDTRPTGFVETMRVLTEKSTPDDIVMTRDPWELNWYTRRRALMIPYEDIDRIEGVAAIVGVTMLQLGGPVDRVNVDACPDDPASKGPFPTGSRPALGGLYCGREQKTATIRTYQGYTLVYQRGGGTIYRLLRDAGP